MAEQTQTKIQAFLTRLTGCAARDDRGTLADLRHGFSAATEHRAWPHLAAWGVDLCNDRERRIWLTIAAGFATLKSTRRRGNLGATMRRIAVGGGRAGDDVLRSFEGRFRRLLTCATPEELCIRLPAVIRAAARKDVAIDFEQLFWDLERWPIDSRGADVRVEWAQAYWGSAYEDTEQEGGA